MQQRHVSGLTEGVMQRAATDYYCLEFVHPLINAVFNETSLICFSSWLVGPLALGLGLHVTLKSLPDRSSPCADFQQSGPTKSREPPRPPSPALPVSIFKLG